MSGCIIHPCVFGQADKTRHLSTSSPKSRWSLPASGWEIDQKKNDENPRSLMEQKIYKYRPVPNWVPTPQWNFWKLLSNKNASSKTFCCALPPVASHVSLVATLAGKFFGQTHLTSVFQQTSNALPLSKQGDQPELQRPKLFSTNFDIIHCLKAFHSNKTGVPEMCFFWCWKIFGMLPIYHCLTWFYTFEKEDLKKGTAVYIFFLTQGHII